MPHNYFSMYEKMVSFSKVVPGGCVASIAVEIVALKVGGAVPSAALAVVVLFSVDDDTDVLEIKFLAISIIAVTDR